jgi:hypothetical protein
MMGPAPIFYKKFPRDQLIKRDLSNVTTVNSPPVFQILEYGKKNLTSGQCYYESKIFLIALPFSYHASDTGWIGMLTSTLKTAAQSVVLIKN